MKAWSRPAVLTLLAAAGCLALFHAKNQRHGRVREAPYDLTQMKTVDAVLKCVNDRYVDPKRVKPEEMLLSALDFVQKSVAQVTVVRDAANPRWVKVRVDTRQKSFRVDDVQTLGDVSARLREVFAFLQDGLSGTDVNLRERVEYAACNGMLATLDPHSELLSPEACQELNRSMAGQYAGLGLVTGIRDQLLTVMNLVPGTPAARAGIRRYDRITRINDKPALNLGLEEALNLMRGVAGTKVTVWLQREGPDGWDGAKPFELTRELIHVASVEAHRLDGGIGYLRIKQFQATTGAEFQAALTGLGKGGGLRGLVLDLRGNGGGLLDQAARVADTFIKEGPIVATVGHPGGQREVRFAHGQATEPEVPLVVLVNGMSASASEVLTGALKNHDRAVIMGETTFGKGSVQIFMDLPDKAALKLTIAQYLTEPGDVSIQDFGVTPDVELVPMTVDRLEMDLTAATHRVKERDLARTLTNVRAKQGAHPSEVVKYDLPIQDRLELRERGGDLPDDFTLDFPIRFAHAFVGHVKPGNRSEQLREARPFVNHTRQAEIDKVTHELKAMAIDRRDAPVHRTACPHPRPWAGRWNTVKAYPRCCPSRRALCAHGNKWGEMEGHGASRSQPPP